MFKKILFGLFLIIFSACLSYFIINQNKIIVNKKLHENCLYPVVLITNKDIGSHGTGFVVKSIKISENRYENVFITCAHVCSSESSYVVNIYGYNNWSNIEKTTEYNCCFYAKNNDLDLAIGMFISEELVATVQFDFNSDIFIGNNVFSIGCGMGDDPRLGEGKITGVRMSSLSNKYNYLKTNVFTIPGDSGAPLFNNDYKVIGLIQSIRLSNGATYYNISHAIPIEELKTWSEQNNNAYDFVWTNKDLPMMPFHRLNLLNKIEPK